MSDQPPTHYEYDTAIIRQLLMQAFNDEEFSIFCFDHFPFAYKDFTIGMTFRAKVQLLIEHCQQTHTFDELLPLVKANNPRRYAEFSDLLSKPRPVRAAPIEPRLEIASESPAKIFLSYSRQDLAMARRLAGDLQQSGFAVWWDVSDLQGGESWGRTIQAAIRASQCCLVLLSPNSIESEWVEREYMYAMRLGLKIIPVLYRECDIPLALINKQYLDFQGSNYERGLRQLLTTLTDKGAPPAPQPSQPHAKKKVLAAPRKPLWAGIGLGVLALVALCGAVYALSYSGALRPSPTATRPQTITGVVIAPTDTPHPTSPPADTPTSTPVMPPVLAETPTSAPSIGRIAFSSERDGNFEIYVMNPDGSGQANLTNNPDYDANPAWSPDGTRIAFVSTRDGNGYSEISMMNANGSEQTNLTNNLAADFTPAWSPDGTRIAFASGRDGNNEIYVMNADGSGQTNLTNNSASDWPSAWSPDGTRIAFNSDRDGNWEIYVMNADGSGQTNLTNNPAFDTDSTWSPDGTRIAFNSDRDGNWEIYVMNADGSGQTNLTNNPASDTNSAWSPR